MSRLVLDSTALQPSHGLSVWRVLAPIGGALWTAHTLVRLVAMSGARAAAMAAATPTVEEAAAAIPGDTPNQLLCALHTAM